MIEPYALVLVALAGYRLARLVALDGITETPREWLVARSPGKMSDLWDCPFCVGVYTTAGSLAAWVFGGEVGGWLVTIAACIGAQAAITAAVER